MRTLLLTAALATTAAFATPVIVLAQGTPQTVQLVKVDVMKISTGYRASKVIGSTVVNEAGDSVGKVDEIIVGPDGKAPFVVLSVGGFLGVGDKLVVLPYEQMKTDGKKIVLPGATKDSLKSLPEFKYAS
jgi:sporulation protein YlmC with PRC-barrel domain